MLEFIELVKDFFSWAEIEVIFKSQLFLSIRFLIAESILSNLLKCSLHNPEIYDICCYYLAKLFW